MLRRLQAMRSLRATVAPTHPSVIRALFDLDDAAARVIRVVDANVRRSKLRVKMPTIEALRRDIENACDVVDYRRHTPDETATDSCSAETEAALWRVYSLVRRLVLARTIDEEGDLVIALGRALVDVRRTVAAEKLSRKEATQ